MAGGNADAVYFRRRLVNYAQLRGNRLFWAAVGGASGRYAYSIAWRTCATSASSGVSPAAAHAPR